MPDKPNIDKSVKSFDTIAVVLITILACAGVIVALMMISIADQSEKHIQEIRQTKISGDAMKNSIGPAQYNADDIIGQYKDKPFVGLFGLDFSEKSFSQFAELKDARVIRMHDCNYDPKWLRYLAQPKKVERLELENTSINGDGLKCLAQAPSLIDLSLVCGPIKDEDLASLPPQLKELTLCMTRLTDKGMPHLQKIRHLERLDLGHTPISDAGLKSIGKLTDLTFLDVRYTAVSDQGLSSLANLKKLRNLHLENCHKLTIAGVNRLRKSLPQTEINWSK